MKKIIASFTVIVYFAFACGVMVNYHYCMDSFASFRLYKAASDWCTKCGMHTKKHGCCHDEVKIVKLQDDYQTSSSSFVFENIQPAVTTPSEFLSVTLLNDDIALNKTDHSPPLLLSTQDAYIQNCVFRI
jgi:hypothetical protein